MSRRAALLRTRWQGLAPREKMLVGGAAALLAVVVVWLIAIGPALATLRTAEEQHRALDTQLQRMRSLQAQAQALQSQPKLGAEEASRMLELSVRQRLGTSARLVIAGERATITLSGVQPDALAQWLTQARVNARALPGEARISRNSAGLWEGTLVLTLPAR
jgi:general secretion pathway protein M